MSNILSINFQSLTPSHSHTRVTTRVDNLFVQSVYVHLGTDKHGLNKYHTLRGTNDVEGFHKHIRTNFASLNASPILADCLLADFWHRYNTEMGAINAEGKKYLGHYDPWLDHQKYELQAKFKWKKNPKLGQLFNESDPLSFMKTHEQFGIAHIPDILWIKCNFDGQVVHDPRTTSGEQLSITRIYPVKLHLASLRGKRTNIWQLLKEQNLLLSPYIQQKNFNYSIPLYSVCKSGSVRFFAPKTGNHGPQLV